MPHIDPTTHTNPMTDVGPGPRGRAAPAEVHTEVLDNGVRVVVREMYTAPVVSLNLWVGTGAVDDPDGSEGIAHFIEHMLFKPDGRSGTDLAREVYGAGGYVNAMTGADHTTYYQVVPSATWRAVLEAQASVVRSPRFAPDEVETERAVILEELRSGEANPETLVWRRLMATGFTRHPLARPVVGTEESLAAVTADTLTSHYGKHYRGGNIVLVVVGDIDAAEVFDEARRLFGDMPGGDRPAYWGGVEPDQKDLRALSIHGALAQPYLSMAFHVPDALHDDIPALDALSGLLGQGRSSRLRRRLALELGLVNDIGSGIAGYRDTGLFIVRGTAMAPDIGPVVNGVMGEIRRLAENAPGDDEMEKNLRRLEAAYLLEHETPEALAGGLGYFELLGDCRLAETYIDRLAAVTPEDVSRVAHEYLRPENATLVVYGPAAGGLPEGNISERMAERVAASMDSGDGTGDGDGSSDGSSDGESAHGAAGDGAAGNGTAGGIGGTNEAAQLREGGSTWAPSGFSRPTILAERRTPVRIRESPGSGITLITSHSNTLPLTSLAIGFRGGHCAEDDASSGSTYVAMRTAIRGSRRRSGFELADVVESMGTSLATLVDRDGFGLGSTCLARLQNDALSLLGEVALEPAFDADQFQMARTEVESEIGETEDHPFRRAILNMLPLIFPEHPYGRALRGTRESIAGLAADAVRDRYLSGLGTAGLVVCASGRVDLPGLRETALRIASLMPDWGSGGAGVAGAAGSEGGAGGARAAAADGATAPTETPGPVLQESVELRHDIPGQSHVALGLRGPAASADDAVALRFVTRALSMMGGPLWVALRENPPHAYSVSASPLLLASGGAVLMSVTARPGDESAAVEGLLSVLRGTRSDGLAPDELTRAKSYVAGTMEIAMQRESSRAASYAMSELLGVGFERMEAMPALVRALTNDDVVRVARAWLDPDAGYATVTLKST